MSGFSWIKLLPLRNIARESGLTPDAVTNIDRTKGAASEEADLEATSNNPHTGDPEPEVIDPARSGLVVDVRERPAGGSANIEADLQRARAALEAGPADDHLRDLIDGALAQAAQRRVRIQRRRG